MGESGGSIKVEAEEWSEGICIEGRPPVEEMDQRGDNWNQLLEGLFLYVACTALIKIKSYSDVCSHGVCLM